MPLQGSPHVLSEMDDEVVTASVVPRAVPRSVFVTEAVMVCSRQGRRKGMKRKTNERQEEEEGKGREKGEAGLQDKRESCAFCALSACAAIAVPPPLLS